MSTQSPDSSILLLSVLFLFGKFEHASIGSQLPTRSRACIRTNPPARFLSAWPQLSMRSPMGTVDQQSSAHFISAPGCSRCGSYIRMRSRTIDSAIRLSVVNSRHGLMSPRRAQHAACAFTRNPATVFAGVDTISESRQSKRSRTS
jgi:hypothetical protein